MTGFRKLLAAAVLSTSLIFCGQFAEAKKKSGTQTVETKKTTKKKKKRTARAPVERTEGYAKAAEYMKRDVASTSEKKAKKSKKKKSAKKKKSRKHHTAST